MTHSSLPVPWPKQLFVATLLAMLIQLLSGPLLAGDGPGREWKIDLGVGVGPGFSRVYVDPAPNVEFGLRPGFNFGFLMAYRVNNRLAFHLEPWYVQNGTEVDSGGINYGGLVHRYLDFSGLACFKLVQTETFPYVVAGAHIAFLQSARRVDVTGATVEEFIPRESRTRNIDAGLVVGAGLYVPTGESNDLRFELLVNPGLLDIDTLSGTSAVTVHNFSVQLRILLVFQNLLKAGG